MSGPKKPRRTMKSLVFLVGVDFSLSLVAIAGAIITVRMQRGDDAKDTQDIALVCVSATMGDCYIGQLTCAAKEGTGKVYYGSEKTSNHVLVSERFPGCAVLVGSHNTRLSCRLSLQPKGCSKSAFEIARDFATQHNERGGSEFKPFLKLYGELLRSRRGLSPKDFDEMNERFRTMLYDESAPGVFSRSSYTPRSDPDIYAKLYASYRIDQIGKKVEGRKTPTLRQSYDDRRGGAVLNADEYAVLKQILTWEKQPDQDLQEPLISVGKRSEYIKERQDLMEMFHKIAETDEVAKPSNDFAELLGKLTKTPDGRTDGLLYCLAMDIAATMHEEQTMMVTVTVRGPGDNAASNAALGQKVERRVILKTPLVNAQSGVEILDLSFNRRQATSFKWLTGEPPSAP